MVIYGRYDDSDKYFITVYSNNVVYTIARNTGIWGYIAVGEQGFTQSMYDNLKKRCVKASPFIIEGKVIIQGCK